MSASISSDSHTLYYSPEIMPASSASALAETHDEILALEEDTWRALQKSGADMIPYIAPDCIFQFPMGMKLTPTSRPSVVDVLHSPAFVPWKKFELSKVDVQSVGKGGAVISYFARAIRPAAGSAERSRDEERDVPFEALCSSVWRWENGKWMMCFHQQTLAS